MAQVISGIITLKQFFEARDSIIGYAEQGDGDDVHKWKLKQNRTYEIPAYQREIKWAENNVLTLVDDISNTRGKFLGNIILSTEDRTKYEIIDGQQRISVLLMLLEGIRKRVDNNQNTISLCTFTNKTFSHFYAALKNDFSTKTDEQFVKADLLNQCETYEKLWKYILDLLPDDNDQLRELESKILAARINVLITKVDPHDDEGKRLCVDYFIDINNKGKHLDSSDILKAYAFRAKYEAIADDWVKVQANEKNLAVVHYPKEAMFLHYLLCCVNHNLERHKHIRLKGLSIDYELVNDIRIESRTYIKGTKVEELITGNAFYEEMMENILKFQEFIKKTVACVGGAPDADFSSLFHATDGSVNMVSLKNYFKIVNGILRNSDVVPKILLMKFFVEILNNPDTKKDDYKVLYDIDTVAIVFSAGNGNAKQLSSYASLVMNKNWIKLLHTRAQKALAKFPQNIKFTKEVQHINKPTKTSGQYLAHRVCGLSSAYTLLADGSFKINEQAYNDYLYANLINDEHLIVPQGLKIHFTYNGKFMQTEPIVLPDKYISQMSYLANYLVIKRAVNDDLKTYCIKEKIRIIEGFIADGEGDVFADSISENMFEIVKEIFGVSSCPTQKDIDSAATADDAKQLLETYYNNNFPDDLTQYFKSITSDKLFSWIQA